MKFFNLSLVLLLVLFASCSKSSNTSDTTPHTTVVSLIADGVTDNAVTLQQAIINCNRAGGGIVEIPAASGKYMTGPIYMLSYVNLQLDAGATLIADTVQSHYRINNKLIDWIRSGNTSLTNVSFTGGGTYDGRGQSWWATYPNDASSRPRMIYITGCTNLTADGITLSNSPSFHFFPYQCKNVIVNNVTIATDPNSPNTDGIDPSQCTGVTITNCTISDGDDNIAIKAADPGPCQKIVVKNCTFLRGHGLSIGSETNGNFDSLTVDNCSFTGTDNGIRLKSYVGVGGKLTNLNYSNITMKDVGHPIVINLVYATPTTPADAIPSVNHFSINNLTITGGGNAGTLVGLSNNTNSIQNVTLSNLNISTTSTTSSSSKMVISNANGVTINNTIINGVAVAPGSGNVTTTNVLDAIGF